MNTEEKLNILSAKMVEVYEAIRDTNVNDEAMPRLLCLAGEIEWKIRALENPEPKEDFTPSPAPVTLDPIEEPKPIETPKPAPATEEPTLTKSQMVAKLTPYQSNGVDIGAVMKDMGYAKLSDVPAARYWELLELVQKAADGEG